MPGSAGFYLLFKCWGWLIQWIPWCLWTQQGVGWRHLPVCLQGGLRPSSCGPHKELDRDSCQCVCKNKLFLNSCGANREFDENTCQCVCKRTCPRNQPLNPGKCACECTENTQKCFLKGKKFHHQTCSCYRRPCTNRLKHCDPGLSFSEEVCRCVPSYWKRPHLN